MTIAQNIIEIHKRIDVIKKHYSRENHHVTLIAVSKYQPIEVICEAIEAGHYIFGENRVQEACEKWPQIKQRYPNLPLQLHLIGPLQTNKVRDAVKLFDVIETVDRLKLALVLKQEMEKQQRQIPCLVQVNIGEEDQKSGIYPNELESFLKQLKQEQLQISGLMCIPPVNDNPALYFGLLAKFAKQYGLPTLSMGMSGDYEQAMMMGATHIRLGTAIFGERFVT